MATRNRVRQNDSVKHRLPNRRSTKGSSENKLVNKFAQSQSTATLLEKTSKMDLQSLMDTTIPRTVQPVKATQIKTPIGMMTACATEHGICILEFNDSARVEQQIMRYRRLTSSCFSVGRNIHLTKLRKELREYMAGLRTDFTVALDLQGTAFQRTVWNALRALPYGAQISYNDLAVAVSRPEAVRAVGAANGANPLSIVVPCHRILGSNGQLTGYGGGIERKAWLLSLESEGTCR